MSEIQTRVNVAMSEPAVRLIDVDEACEITVRLTPQEIADFARLTGDLNPLHHDDRLARRGGHAGVIASGQQTSARLMGLAATHFSRIDEAGAREVLGLNFNFAFKAPVLAAQDVRLRWRVNSVEWRASLRGWVAELSGDAMVGERRCVIARGTLLVRPAVPA